MQVNQDDRITPQETSSSSNRFALIAIVLVVLLSAGGYYYYTKDDSPKLIPNAPIVLPEPPSSEPMTLETGTEPETAPVENEAPAATTPETETTVTPTEPAIPEEVVPSLPESDAFVHQKALAIINNNVVGSSLVNQDLARQFVVFVDNLAQGDLARKVSPVKGPEKLFTVSEITSKVYLNPESYHRYDAYATVLASMDEQA